MNAVLEKLKAKVYDANLELVRQHLVLYTWGNVSARDPETGLVVIKPSGVAYDDMAPTDMVVVTPDGAIVEGALKPSSDTPTHLALYRRYPEILSVVHTHSEWATSWAQSGRDIPCYGTTHSDTFYGNIPCTRKLTDDEIHGDYERATGQVIVETLEARGEAPLEMPGAVVCNHGPFTWGTTPEAAVYHAKVLEEVAKMAYRTENLNGAVERVEQVLIDKHYLRKHGAGAYYGQK